MVRCSQLLIKCLVRCSSTLSHNNHITYNLKESIGSSLSNFCHI